MEKTKKIQSLSSSKTTWINITNAGKKEIDYLQKNFRFHDDDLKDSMGRKSNPRAKIRINAKYIFVVLLFPRYDRETKKVFAEELDIFITKDHLITSQLLKRGVIGELFEQMKNNSSRRKKIFGAHPLKLLDEILHDLYEPIFGMLDHLSSDINEVEQKIFTGKERKMVAIVLKIKTNIVSFLKIMQSHKRILRKIVEEQKDILDAQHNYSSIYEEHIYRLKTIWDILESDQQTANNLEDANNILVTFRLNDIMKTLTMFSVIVFPLTLFAAIFGMNVSDLPIVGNEGDFWTILFWMLILTFGMFWYFKYKKWI